MNRLDYSKNHQRHWFSNLSFPRLDQDVSRQTLVKIGADGKVEAALAYNFGQYVHYIYI